MPRASSPAVTAPAKRHGSGPPPLPCPPGPRCGSHGHLALRATAALPAGLPPLAQTLARAPTGSPPPALARRTFSKQSGSLCTTPGPSEAAPCSWPTGRPGANLTPCHTFLRHLLCIVPLLPARTPPTCGELGPASTAWSPMPMSPSRGNPAQSLAPKGLPLSRAGFKVLGGWKVSCSVGLSPNPRPRHPLSESPSVSALFQLSSCSTAL